jgi:hypothetical protein
MLKRPLPSEYPPPFAGYVDHVPEVDVVGALGAQVDVLRQLAAVISPERETYAYAPDKWTIRQLVGHLGDVERVFSFRALCFARSDQTPLPGFDENAYVENSRFNDTRLGDLIEEFVLLRSSNLKMFTSLSEAQWSATGVANGKSISVRALAYVMVGHVRHHVAMLRDRYGVGGGGR